MSSERETESFAEAVEEHGREGLEILMGTSSFLAHGIIYILMVLLFVIFIWSFYGRADVIISAEGQIDAESEMKRIYTPAAGELIDVYATEGMTVSGGDLLARIKAPDAIQAATSAIRAEIDFEKADLEMKMFPQKKNILEKELKGIKEQIAQRQETYNTLKTTGMSNISESKRKRLESLDAQIAESNIARGMAETAFKSYSQLYETEGHGGLSKIELKAKKAEYLKADTSYRRLVFEKEGLELEYSKQPTEADQRIDQIYIELVELRLKYDAKEMEYKNAEKEVNMRYKAAEASLKAAAVVTFDDLDADNFLTVRTPVSGEITAVSSTQRGEKIRAEEPLVSVAPASAEKVLMVKILEKDRGLLKVGQPVKIKFSAFPYQRYGFINGVLEYISPGATASKKDEIFYKGRISLDRDYFMEDNKKIPVRYGMTALAEIVVEKRRMIELALDPFRKMKS